MSVEILLSCLDGVQRSGDGRWRATCPAHPSKHKSRSLAVRDADGRVLMHCFAGCSVDAIVGALGMNLSDLFDRVDDDQHRKPRERRPFSARDALACVAHESIYVAVVAGDLARGEMLSESDRARLALAAERINSALEVVGT